MIYSVTGNVVAFDTSMVAIDVNGVAFHCITTLTTSQKCASVGAKVTLYTYMNVREDAIELFGFYDKTEMDCFKMLITVNGVGPKMALVMIAGSQMIGFFIILPICNILVPSPCAKSPFTLFSR